MKTVLASTALLAALATTVWAQGGFQLPRECSDRNYPHPEKCVIPDGPPRTPWVHRSGGQAVTPASAPTPSAPSIQPPQAVVVRKVIR